MVRARGASGPGRRLLLLLGLLAALRARDSRAAPRAAPGPDVAVEDGYPVSRLGAGFEPQEIPTDVAMRRASLASRLDPFLEPWQHATGPQRAQYEAKMGKSSQESSEVLQEILKDLEGAAENHQETLEKETFPAGGSHSLPVSDEEREAVQATGMPAVPGGDGDAGAWPDAGPKAWEDAGGRPRAFQPQGSPRGNGYPSFWLFPLPEPREDPRDVADIDGHAASQLDPHFEPRDGRASVSLQRAYPASQLDAVAEPPGLPRGGPSGLEPQGSPRGVPAGGGLLGSQLDPTSEPQGHARNVAIGGGDLSSHLDSDFESLGNPRDVPEGSVSPASQGLKPLLEPQGDRRGLAGDEDAQAAAHKAQQKQRLVLSAAVSGSVVFAVVLTCIVTFRLRKRKQEAMPANPAAASNREESSTEEGRAKPGSDREKDGLTLENENFNNSSRRLPVNFATELAQLFDAMNSKSSFQPRCQSNSDGGYGCSSNICISRDFPQGDHSKCVCFRYQEGYCTSDAYSE
ncbi:uncharacterized protein LOC135323800 isoform X1 [Dromaius novaehollandiae]|uniref:uncharacterized protein LOC135323800 isoform X1 n=2 Tax=Dromaius novaehollandiae TaxID=8790 RepID=UPI00311DC065